MRAKFRAPGYQTCIANLVNQSSITDLEGHCRSPAVPLIRTQSFENEIALHVADRFPGDALQGTGIRFVGGCLRGRRAPLRRFRDNRGLRPDQNIPRDTIRKFAQIPGPIQVSQVIQHLRFESRGLLYELPLILLLEISCKDCDVFTALAQSRQSNAGNMDAILPISAEAARLDPVS